MCSCQSRAEKFYKQAQEKLNEGKFLEAVDLLENSSELEKNNRIWSKTNFEIAKILRLDIQDYLKAISVYKKIILTSEDVSLRLQSQEAIAEVYFDNLQDYQNALKEFIILEPLIKDKKKLENIKLKIAQCYRFSGNNKAALETVESALVEPGEQKIYFLKNKAEILYHLNKFDESIVVLNELNLINSDFFKKENLYLSMAMSFEGKEDFQSAIMYLEQNKNNITDKALLDLRIKRLKEKLKNKPFTKGIRK